MLDHRPSFTAAFVAACRGLSPMLPRAARLIDDPLGLRFSAGFGIRWFSPLGPLRFEWGMPMSPRVPFEAGSFPGRFEFTIGNFF